MHFSLTSLSGTILSTEKLESVTVSTENGTIAILPNHMPLVSALKPGVLEVAYEGKTVSFAVGGGVLETDGKELRIIADMIEDGGYDLVEIEKRKKDAETLMAEYRVKGDQISMESLIELESEYLKDIAREQLARK